MREASRSRLPDPQYAEARRQQTPLLNTCYKAAVIQCDYATERR
jgi:hypothetical protein